MVSKSKLLLRFETIAAEQQNPQLEVRLLKQQQFCIIQRQQEKQQIKIQIQNHPLQNSSRQPLCCCCSSRRRNGGGGGGGGGGGRGEGLQPTTDADSDCESKNNAETVETAAVSKFEEEEDAYYSSSSSSSSRKVDDDDNICGCCCCFEEPKKKMFKPL